MSENEAKTVYKLPPCESYDIEGTECWLEDMAANGYILEKDGFFLGFASFRKSEPQKLRYRLEAAPKPMGFLSSHDVPDEDAVALSAALGWEYISTRDQFYIYAASDADAEELNTDPQVQALALQKIRKRERGIIISNIMWFILYPLLLIETAVIRTVLTVGFWFSLYSTIMLCWILIDGVRRALHLRRLYQTLKANGTLDHRKAWNRKAMRNRILPLVQLAMIFVWIGWLLAGWGADITEENTISIFDYSEDPPFATVADYAPGGTYEPMKMSYTNKVTEKSDLLAPRLLEWTEHADLKTVDGKFYEMGMYVDYFETVSPLISKGLIWEYERQNKRDDDYKPMELSAAHDLDYASLYIGHLHMTTLLLRKNNTVGRFQYYQYGKNTLPLEDWIQITISEFDRHN